MTRTHLPLSLLHKAALAHAPPPTPALCTTYRISDIGFGAVFDRGYSDILELFFHSDHERRGFVPLLARGFSICLYVQLGSLFDESFGNLEVVPT